MWSRSPAASSTRWRRDELEAVLAHELTHIRNRDTQLMVIAVIFAGIFAFFGDLVIRGWDFPYGWSPRPKTRGRGAARRPPRLTSSDWSGSERSDGDSRSSGKGSGGALLAIALPSPSS